MFHADITSSRKPAKLPSLCPPAWGGGTSSPPCVLSHQGLLCVSLPQGSETELRQGHIHTGSCLRGGYQAQPQGNTCASRTSGLSPPPCLLLVEVRPSLAEGSWGEGDLAEQEEDIPPLQHTQLQHPQDCARPCSAGAGFPQRQRSRAPAFGSGQMGSH